MARAGSVEVAHIRSQTISFGQATCSSARDARGAKIERNVGRVCRRNGMERGKKKGNYRKPKAPETAGFS
jgi:hypothetical protein